jgi:hypothetical protein
MRQVGNREHELPEPLVEFGNALFALFDFVRDALHLGQQTVGIFAGAFATRDFLSRAIAFRLEPFARGNALAPFAVERAKSVEVDGAPAAGGHLFELREVLAKIIQVVHEIKMPLCFFSPIVEKDGM